MPGTHIEILSFICYQKKCKFKTTVRYYFTHTWMAIIKKVDHKNVVLGMCRNIDILMIQM